MQATPERAAGLERALLAVKGYANVRDGGEETPKGFVLRQLGEEIPALVTRSLVAAPPPAPRSADPASKEADESLARKISSYERALRDIGESARFANEDQQEHELLHMLEVEILDIASETLNEYRQEPPEEDVNQDDDFWIPF